MTKTTTRAVTNPGDDPKNNEQLQPAGGSPAPDAFQANAVVTGAGDAAGEDAGQAAQIEALLQATRRSNPSVGAAEPLPSYHKELAKSPTSPVLTDKGWIVPANWAVATGNGVK